MVLSLYLHLSAVSFTVKNLILSPPHILTDIGYCYYTPKLVNMSVGVVKIMIIYNKLWEAMKKRGISQYALIKDYGISPAQITRLKRNESVSTHTIDMFCNILHCEVEDIMTHIADKE